VVYADCVNILGGSIHKVQENEEASKVANNEIGTQVNADKTKYKVMSRDQNVGRSHNMKIENGPFERVEEFKFWVKNLTKQNYNREETKTRLKSRNAC